MHQPTWKQAHEAAQKTRPYLKTDRFGPGAQPPTLLLSAAARRADTSIANKVRHKEGSAYGLAICATVQLRLARQAQVVHCESNAHDMHCMVWRVSNWLLRY
jgi:hypothetical protein